MARRNKKKIEQELMLQRLEELASRMGITVQYEANLPTRGGLCRLKGEQFLMCDKKLPASEKIALIGEILSESEELDSLYVVPEVRNYIECLKKQRAE